MNTIRRFLILMTIASLNICFTPAIQPAVAASGDQQFANLGECKLESGSSIKECRIGYRTFGSLNSDKSNVVVVLPPLVTTSEGFAQFLQTTRIIDTAKNYAVVIDRLANGVSTSPSNSKTQPGDKFPTFTVKDMMNVQYRLLTEVLEFKHVRAIYGGGLGGMEAFEWLVRYPAFMDKVITLQATPKSMTSDLVVIDVATRLLKSNTATAHEKELLELGFAALWTQAGNSPDFINAKVPTSSASDVMNQWLFATKTMITQTPGKQMDTLVTYQEPANHDIFKAFGGSMEKAAKTVKAKTLIVVADDDHAVNPGPSLDFAKLINAKTLRVTGGAEGGFRINAAQIIKAVSTFLDES